MLKTAGTDVAVFPPTLLYNEGWMLRIVLSIQSKGIKCLPFPILPGAKWFSEAQMGSPFLPRYRGDPLAESLTHVDGVIGHFIIRSGTKTGLVLTTNSKQFVVIEAKMFSLLTRGIKNAHFYDQATRTVACISWTIEQSNRSVKDFESLAFYIITPHEQIRKGLFSEQMSKSSIREKMEWRIETYSIDDETYTKLRMWQNDFFNPLLTRIDLCCISWESAIEAIKAANSTHGPVIRDFYNRCLKFNRRARTRKKG